MKLTYGKLVQALYLVLFTASSIISFFQFHTNAVIIAALSLVGFISFDIICYLRKRIPAPSKDIQPELDKVMARSLELESKFNTVLNEAGLSKLTTIFRK